ncbi:hypothetical protein QLL95_gp0895 [Cotonvirus japonicus]|uniref:Uncharacterized protein n=1 Tax=Cotonvirus japonicus TaxID=2811091 RepID=A0ABM7NST4_9VIRU|nr:hypothetical protein QLL95_gp0895 [Cotonvirus japonicus]BCS83228.1 hypothetical protein [Cotonvirus japonicus]
MSTIANTMETLSYDVQMTFEELVKLLLRKTQKPITCNNKNNIIYNAYTGKYEKGLVTSSHGDNINKYVYRMTKESLGWSDDTLANFSVDTKHVKNNTLQKLSTNHKPSYVCKSKSRLLFSDRDPKNPKSCSKNKSLGKYKNMLAMINSRDINNVIVNKKSGFIYSSNIPYTYAFHELEDIGKDIIDQTDPSILGCDSAKMSTAMLRVRLYTLEQNLSKLSVKNPSIFDAYVEMIRVINSLPKNKLAWIIRLIASLTYQRWDDVEICDQERYRDMLGDDFIDTFNSNELITILLQSNASEFILKSSLLFPLIKMLFIVFGYSKLVPVITDVGNSEQQEKQREALNKHYEKYRGATIRRGEYGQTCYPNDIYSESDNNIPQKPEPEPIDQCVYDFIRLFGDLYPTVVGLMGGTEKFPPEMIEMTCSDIPANYNDLMSITEYLWRFNDYSYCKYLEYVCTRQLHNILDYKINEKTRYLHSI